MVTHIYHLSTRQRQNDHNSDSSLNHDSKTLSQTIREKVLRGEFVLKKHLLQTCFKKKRKKNEAEAGRLQGWGQSRVRSKILSQKKREGKDEEEGKGEERGKEKRQKITSK